MDVAEQMSFSFCITWKCAVWGKNDNSKVETKKLIKCHWFQFAGMFTFDFYFFLIARNKIKWTIC